MILGQTRGERFRTAATAIFLALTGVCLVVCLVAEGRQETGYRSSLVKFAQLAAAYAKQHGFEPQDGGGRRQPHWREGRYSICLVKGDEELYILRGTVLCGWSGAKLQRVEIGFPPFEDGGLRTSPRSSSPRPRGRRGHTSRGWKGSPAPRSFAARARSTMTRASGRRGFSGR